MKKLVLFLVVSIIALPIFCQSRAERRAEKKAKIEAQFIETKALIDSKQYMFEAKWAIPLGNEVANIGMDIPGGGAIFQGDRVDVSSNSNFVEITDNNANVFLPFFGRTFFPRRHLNQNGIEFKGDIEDYSIQIKESKKQIIVKWSGDPADDFLKFIMKINANGHTTVTVNSSNRQSITYDGHIKAIEEN